MSTDGDAEKGKEAERGRSKARGKHASGGMPVPIWVAIVSAAATLGAALIGLVPVLVNRTGSSDPLSSQPARTGVSVSPTDGGASGGSPSTPALTTDTPGPGSAPAATLLYRDKPFALHGGGCNDANSYNNFPYVLFLPQGLTNVQKTPSRPSSPFGMVLDCSKLSIAYGALAAIVTGKADYEVCYSAVTYRAISGDIPLSRLNLNTRLCLINNQSSELAVVTPRSLSASATDTTWSVSVYRIRANN